MKSPMQLTQNHNPMLSTLYSGPTIVTPINVNNFELWFQVDYVDGFLTQLRWRLPRPFLMVSQQLQIFLSNKDPLFITHQICLLKVVKLHGSPFVNKFDVGLTELSSSSFGSSSNLLILALTYSFTKWSSPASKVVDLHCTSRRLQKILQIFTSTLQRKSVTLKRKLSTP